MPAGTARSYEHAGKVEAQLKVDMAELLARAEAADQADVSDGMSIPEELARRAAAGVHPRRRGYSGVASGGMGAAARDAGGRLARVYLSRRNMGGLAAFREGLSKPALST